MKSFIAPAGCQIVSADYSQIELRIMAHLSRDASLLRAFADGMDVHRATASEVFGVPVDEVSAEQRRYAKTIKPIIVPMHKSNYVPVTNLEDLKGINSKGGWYR